MSVSTPTEALDVQDFQFKLLCRLQVFHAEENLGAPAVNLVATASKYGLIFVGCPSSIQVLQSSSLVKLGSSAVTGEVSEYPRREVPLPSRPSHFAVSCDQSYLVVTLLKDSCDHALVYSVTSFASQNINQVCEVRLSASPDCRVLDAVWNPGVANVLGSVLSDGSLGVFEFKASGVDINNLPQAAQATCFSWSPKGKQLVVGDSNGALTQYKPDLKAVKVLPAPSLGGNPVAVVNVVWLSNYQFAAVYQDKLNSMEKPCLLIVNAPKTGDVTFVNYEDICYSSGETRSPQFYLIHQPSWNVLLAASANSMELGVLGLASDQVSWMQWVLEDASRAELPLNSATREETYPVGVGLDTSTQHELPWGENQTIPPMPVLHMLSHQGVLCLFYAINLRPDAIRVCTPPDQLPDTSGLALFTTPTTSAVSPAPTLALPSPRQEEQLQESQQTPTQGGWLAQSAADSTISNIRVNLTQKFEELKPSPAAASVSTFGGPRTSFNFGSGGAGLLPLAATPVPTSAVAPQMRTSFDSNPPKLQQSAPLFGGPKTSFSSPGAGAGFALTTDNQSPANFSYSLPGTPGTATPSALPQKVGSQPEQSTAASEQISRPTPHVESPPIILNIPPVPITAPQLSRPAVMGDNVAGQNAGREESTADSAACVAAIRDETFTFHKEMTDLLASVSALDCKIGQEEEMSVLLEKPEMLLEFFRELKETTVAQSSEIHELKTIMVEAFAWLEDARSKLNLLNNPSYIQLTRSQALDPISSKYAEDIRRMRYYIESQLHEINITLDSKWARFQDSRKDGAKKKLQVPSLEVVYSTMVMHSNILKKQKQLLEGLLARLPETTRKQIGTVPLVLGVSLSQEKDGTESELSKLAETLVEIKLNPSEGDSNSLKLDQLFVTNISRKQLSFLKQVKLRELFDQRKVVHICPTKPASVNFPLVAALSRISSTQDLASAFPVSSVKPGGITTGQPIVKKSTPPQQAFPVFRGTDANISLQKSSAPKSSSTTTIAFSADKDTPIAVTTSKPESVESLFVFGQSKVVSSQLEGIENKKTGVAEGINFQKFKFPVESNENESASFVAKPGLSPGLFGLSKNFTESPSFKQSGSFSVEPSSKEASGKKKEGEFTFSTPTPSKSNFSFSTSGLVSKPPPVTVPKVDEQQTKQAESISFTSFQEPGKRKDVFGIETSGFAISSSKMEPPPRVEEQATPLQKSPLMSLGNIVASIGNDKTTNKNSEKTSEIFGKVGGSVKSPETFKFSLGGSFGGLLSSPSAPTVIGADTGKESPPKSSSSGPGVNLKTPLLSFGGNVTQDSPPATSIFGGSGDKSQKTATSATGNIFGGGSSFNFGSLMKSPSSTNLFGAVTSTSDAVGASSKQSRETNSDEESTTHAPPKEDDSAASKENQQPAAAVVTSPEMTLNQPFFNNLSFGRSPDNVASSNLFSGGISTPSTTFTFSKSASSPSSPQQQKQEEENSSSTSILGSILASNSTTAQETKVSPADASQSTFSFASLTTTLSPSTSESQPSSTGVETKPAPGSIFGGSLSATTSAQASSASFSFALPPASTTSAFGLKSPNMFALTSTPSTVTTTSSTSSFFSQPIRSPSSTFGQSGGSIFGQATTGSTLFGQTSTTTNTSLFGQTTTTTSSIFGQLAITSPSLFGQTGTTPSFGQAPSTTIASMFGQTQTTTASAFGQTSSTTSALPFGQTAPTTSTSIFGMKQSSNSSIFGQNQTSSGPAAFGNTSSAFGQTSSTESSVFGQSPTNTTSFFGAGAGAFGAKSMFEQSGGSIFGQNTSKPAFGSSGGSLFGGGSSSLFGSSGAAATPSGNLFQSSGGSSLFGGSTAGGSPGGSGAFSSGVGGSIIQTGFGAGSFSQTKPGGFGSPPAFGQSGGSSPGFGAPATFGGSPTFGGAPTFGSPAKIFGNSSPTGGFGSPPSPQQPTAFENLATQNTMTFGNLAQTQGQNPGFVPPNQNVFGTAPASQPAFQSQGSSSFGGNSFSSWR